MNSDKIEDYLVQLFDSKKEKNPRFSLRAFAKFLDLEPSFLSKILRGKYKLNKRIIEELAQKMGLDAEVTARCVQGNADRITRHRFIELEEDTLRKIGNWQTFVILRYLDIDKNLNIPHLAEKLEITEKKVQGTIDLLEDLQLIIKENDGSYRRADDGYIIRNKQWQSALNRDLAKQYINKALESVEKNPVDKRTHVTSVFSMKQTSYDRIREKVSDLIMEIARCAREDEGSEDQIMIMNINLFPVIQK